MARFIRKTKKEIGLAPDELLFRGKQKIDKVLLRVMDCDSDELHEKSLEYVSEVTRFSEKETLTWLNVDGLHDPDIMSEIADTFDLDRLVVAAVMETNTRARVKEYESCLLISIKMLQHDEENDKVSVEHLSLILVGTTLISFQEKKGDVFEPVRNRIRGGRKRIRSSGPDYLAFALLDIVIDNYIYILSRLGRGVERLEDILVGDPPRSVVDEINGYKRELNFLRKNIHPAREMAQALTKTETEFIREENMVFFRDLQSNASQAVESADSYREILSDQLNLYHTNVAGKLNDIMKVLTVFSVIFIPLTFIAGIYGTNFDYLPELHFKYSYYVMWGVMFATAVTMLGFFKKKRWL